MSRVLVVDDDPDIRDIVAIKLRRAGLEVVVAPDGASALELARARPPDLVLLDWAMPKLDGLEVSRRLRRDGATSAVPIVMLTARVQDVDRQAGFAAGVTLYVTKPFSPRELVARIVAVLDGAG